MTTTLPDSPDARREPIDRRRILALIALADELPAPREVRFIPGDASYPEPLLALTLDNVDQATTWAAWFGATRTGVETYGAVTLYTHSLIKWHGWRVRLDFHPGTPDAPLDDVVRERLERVADVTPDGDR